MSDNKFRGNYIDDKVTLTTSMVSSRSSNKVENRKRKCERRILLQPLAKDDMGQKYNDEMTKHTLTRPTIRHSKASTDLTSAACIKICEPHGNNRNSVADTGTVEARRGANDQRCRERYALVETPGCAGTFRMSIVSDPVCERDEECLIEFTVWKTMKSPRPRRLWFTVRHMMSPAAAVGIRFLEVWVDRKNDYPAKVIFLKK
ncbi:hypothetical protein AGLY_000514 [Aphis glycines]|uniref:Uncharacterized protein n=1 Tax=Aphis glycines TaxID=307491 RepID=A0A6G0U775_APHGL|nr:hypothetical protein AGLY_000514 [Aphis glycines]